MRREAYESLPDILNAGMLAEALGISRAGAYQLLNSADFPTLQIGKRKLVPKDKLIAWITLPLRHLLAQMWDSSFQMFATTIYQIPAPKATKICRNYAENYVG